jgi:hypothetical protein
MKATARAPTGGTGRLWLFRPENLAVQSPVGGWPRDR